MVTGLNAHGQEEQHGSKTIRFNLILTYDLTCVPLQREFYLGFLRWGSIKDTILFCLKFQVDAEGVGLPCTSLQKNPRLGATQLYVHEQV